MMTKVLNSTSGETMSEEHFEDTRNLRIAQLNNLIGMAVDAYERSQQHDEQSTTTEKPCSACRGTGTESNQKSSEPVKCDSCKGRGKEEIEPGKYEPCNKCQGIGTVPLNPDSSKCSVCHGHGKIVLETKRQSRRAGDPAYLRVAKSLIESAAKLEGVYQLTNQVTLKLERDSGTAAFTATPKITTPKSGKDD